MSIRKLPPAPAPAPGSSSPDAASVASMLAQVAAVTADGRTDLERLPKRLSPSRAGDFRQCPQAFWFKTIAKLSSPPTEATARGTLVHAVFERVFDHPPQERTPQVAKAHIRPEWKRLTSTDLDPTSRGYARALANAVAYQKLAPAGSPTEVQILEFAERCVDNWFAMERVANFSPAQVQLPSGDIIDGRELALGAALFGVYVHGFIDRLDCWQTAHGAAYAISDFKTGSVPGAGKSYPQHVQQRIDWESFFQLRLYAVLAQEVYGIAVQQLRLIYVATGDREQGIKTLRVTKDVIDRTRNEIRATWSAILRAANAQVWQPRPGKLCSWCYFAPLCPAFAATDDSKDVPTLSA